MMLRTPYTCNVRKKNALPAAGKVILKYLFGSDNRDLFSPIDGRKVERKLTRIEV